MLYKKYRFRFLQYISELFIYVAVIDKLEKVRI